MSQQITGTTGTPTIPTVKGEDNGGSVAFGDEGHIVIQTGVKLPQAAMGLGTGNMNLDSKIGVQGDREGYQELMSFVNLCATNWGIDGLAVMYQLRLMLNALLLNTEERRVYLP
jgi:hypothetical protein